MKFKQLSTEFEYNGLQLTAKLFLNVNLFMWVKPIVAMLTNERNMMGGAEQREVTDDHNWYIILELNL